MWIYARLHLLPQPPPTVLHTLPSRTYFTSSHWKLRPPGNPNPFILASHFSTYPPWAVCTHSAVRFTLANFNTTPRPPPLRSLLRVRFGTLFASSLDNCAAFTAWILYRLVDFSFLLCCLTFSDRDCTFLCLVGIEVSELQWMRDFN